MNDFYLFLCLFSALSFFLQVSPPPGLETMCSPNSPHTGLIPSLRDWDAQKQRLLWSSMIFLPYSPSLTPARSCMLSELPSEAAELMHCITCTSHFLWWQLQNRWLFSLGNLYWFYYEEFCFSISRNSSLIMSNYSFNYSFSFNFECMCLAFWYLSYAVF